MTIDNLDRLASLMNDLGFQRVRVGFECYSYREVPIIHIGRHFFPSWELSDINNLALFTSGMFRAIEAKRPANWQPVKPLLEGPPTEEWEKPAEVVQFSA